MAEQNIMSSAKAAKLIEDPRFELGETWHAPAMAHALSYSAPFENASSLSNAIRAFMVARTAPDEIDRFLKLWTALNALRNHIMARFETAQAAYLHLNPEKLPKRYRIQTMDYTSLAAFAALIDPAHPLPGFGALRSPVFCDAQRTLGNLADDLLRECTQNPRGVLAQLTETPSASASGKGRARATATATEKLFALAEGLGLSPLVFVMLVAAYELRNGLIHGSVPLPLPPDERCKELEALGLCSLALDAFLHRALPQTVQQLDAGNDRLAPFPEPCRETIAHYLDHRFDGYGIAAKLRKYGLIQ